MATEIVKRSPFEFMDGWQTEIDLSLVLSKVDLSLDLSLDLSKVDLSKIMGYCGTAMTTSMMMSQTAFDALLAVFGSMFRRSCLKNLDFDIYCIMDRVMERIVKRGDFHHVPLFLDSLRRGLDSDHDVDCLIATLLRRERAVEGMYKNETCDGALPSEHSQHAFTVAVAAVLHLLAFVFQYLIGYIDRGGTKTYSSGCFDFRASFVCVLLFLAAFVWIKFRQAAQPSTGKRKQPSHFCSRQNGSVTKYEARFTIPPEKNKAHPVKPPRLSLGLRDTREEAAIVSRVAQSYYEEQPGACFVKLGDHQFELFVPAMSEQERCLVGEEKKKWVVKQAKDVGTKMYEEYEKWQLSVAPGAVIRLLRLSSNPSSSLPFQPSLMRCQTADETLHVMSPPPRPGLPWEETDREVFNPGSQPAEEHSSEELPPIDDVQWECTDADFARMLALTPLNSESSPIPGNDTLPHFGAGAGHAVEHGRPEALPQGTTGAGDPVLHSAEFGPTDVTERSESLAPSRQYHQPQVHDEEVLHQVSDESQNPGLQQVHCMPSPQNFGRLQEVEPSEQVSACQQCERLREEVKRLRKEKELPDEEKERLREEVKRLRKERELPDEEKE